MTQTRNDFVNYYPVRGDMGDTARMRERESVAAGRPWTVPQGSVIALRD